MHHIEFIGYFQVLSIASSDDSCFGQNTVSLSVGQSNCLGELIKTNSQGEILTDEFKVMTDCKQRIYVWGKNRRGIGLTLYCTTRQAMFGYNDLVMHYLQ